LAIKIKLLLCICLISAMAWPQAQRGTILLVIGFKDGPVAVAADSLAYGWNGGAQNTCKIATLGNKLIVAGKVDFSALAIAHEVFSRFPSRQAALKNFGSKFIAEWNKALVDRINQQLKQRGSDITKFLPDDNLTSAIVVGIDEKGLVTTWSARLRYRSVGNTKVAFSMPVKTATDLPYEVYAGENDIANEAYLRTTPRGQEWNHELWQGSAALPSDQKSTYWARQLISLTLRYLPPRTFGGRQIATVGGPIDSVTIDRTGAIKWGDHKPECK
jgi:hypothetical protein